MDELFAWLERYADHIKPYYPLASVAAAKQEVAELRTQLVNARKALEESERFMAYFSNETGGVFVGSGTPKTCLAMIRAELTKPGQLEGSDR